MFSRTGPGRGDVLAPFAAATLKGREPLFVAEFANATGDAVFDETLRTVTEGELDRSPAYALAGTYRKAELLREMGKSPDVRFDSDLVFRSARGPLRTEECWLRARSNRKGTATTWNSRQSIVKTAIFSPTSKPNAVVSTMYWPLSAGWLRLRARGCQAPQIKLRWSRLLCQHDRSKP